MSASAVLVSVLASATSANPLAPAEQGMVQCHEPDDLAKTCRSIAGYRLIGGTTYSNNAVVLISRDNNIILETNSQVEVRDGAVCGTPRARDVIEGRLRVAGSLVPSHKAAPVLAQLVKALSAIIDKEVCTSYAARGGGLVTRESIDGVDHPELMQRVKWVKRSDGYTVSP